MIKFQVSELIIDGEKLLKDPEVKTIITIVEEFLIL